MLHSMGDSHCDFTFAGIPGVVIHRLGPLTMKRVGIPAEPLLDNAAKSLNLSPSDTLVLCFGEIDVRGWVKVHLPRNNNDLDAMLRAWASAYLDRAASLPTPAKVAILAVPPPARAQDIYQTPDFPVNGTDDERAFYTKTLNAILAEGCAQRNLLFVDVHTPYTNLDGMLNKAMSDGSIHIRDNTLVRILLAQMGLIP